MQNQGRSVLVALAVVILVVLGGWMVRRAVVRARCCEEDAETAAETGTATTPVG